MRRRLTDGHRVMVLLQEAMTRMSELGLSLQFEPYGVIKVLDQQTGMMYDLQDNESGCPVCEFPPGLEFKLTYEKDD